jgi:hypothetical protein
MLELSKKQDIRLAQPAVKTVYGWKLSSRFEGALRQLGDKCVGYRNTKSRSEEEDLTLLELMGAR